MKSVICRMRSLNRLRFNTNTVAVLFCLILAACSSTPPAPQWQVLSKDAMDRAVAAYLEGDTSVSQAELVRGRRALAATGRADLMAQAELLYCAARVASLDIQPCAEFEALRRDATPAQQAYADYLSGLSTSEMQALLPAAQQKIAAGNADPVAALQAQPDPLSRLLGASVLLQKGQASTAVLDLAVDTASARGWRRSLLAWLGVRLMRAEQEGDTVATARLQRRIALARSNGKTIP